MQWYYCHFLSFFYFPFILFFLLYLFKLLHVMTSENRGSVTSLIQKARANVQSLKQEGKRTVEVENEGSYAIAPF